MTNYENLKKIYKIGDTLETIVWPVYMDSNKSRSEGRKIKKEYAISKPKITEISRAARKLNLKPKVEDDKFILVLGGKIQEE